MGACDGLRRLEPVAPAVGDRPSIGDEARPRQSDGRTWPTGRDQSTGRTGPGPARTTCTAQPGPRARRVVVLPVGRADHRVGTATAVQRGGAGPAPAAHHHQGRVTDLPAPRAAHARDVRLAGRVRGRARKAAVPYARTLGGGPLTAGLLMCAMPAGTAASSPSRPASAAPPRQQPVGRPWIRRA